MLAQLCLLLWPKPSCSHDNRWYYVACTITCIFPAAPLDAEIDDCDSSQMDRLKCKDPLFPLMYCFLTKFTALEPGVLLDKKEKLFK